MEILILENERKLIENSFKAINLLYFGSQLNIHYAQTSQELGAIENIKKYKLIIVDIDLSINSKKDGITIIKDIAQQNTKDLEKVFVLTGSTKVKEKLKSLGFHNIPVLNKPINITEVKDLMLKILK